MRWRRVLHDGLLAPLGTRGQFERGIVLTLGVSLILQNGAFVIFGPGTSTALACRRAKASASRPARPPSLLAQSQTG